jgi:hypothetical protein
VGVAPPSLRSLPRRAARAGGVFPRRRGRASRPLRPPVARLYRHQRPRGDDRAGRRGPRRGRRRGVGPATVQGRGGGPVRAGRRTRHAVCDERTSAHLPAAAARRAHCAGACASPGKAVLRPAYRRAGGGDEGR